MNKICTSLGQSKKLIELGIDVNTADMYWQTSDNPMLSEHNLPKVYIGEIPNYAFDELIFYPCWSLTALLELMPKSICIKQSEHSGYFYFLEWQFANDNSLRYVGHDRECLIDIYSDHDDNWKDSIDTAFEMVCWLKENSKL